MLEQSSSFLIVGGFICAAGALAGALLGTLIERRRLSLVIQDQSARMAELRGRDLESKEALNDVRSDNRTLTSFLVVLPDVVKQLNSDMAKRDIPPLLAGTLQQLFEPSRILIYMTRGKGELALAHFRGAGEDLSLGRTINFGEGAIGLAAQTQIAMDRDDLGSESMIRRASSSDRFHSALALDLIAPMVHEGDTLGVIAVGGVRQCQRDEKRMIRLVADLGSLALKNSEAFANLKNTANIDSLTRLATKRFLNLKLGELINHAERTHTPLSVAIFDIDHFKTLNDTYGHPAGDEILRTVATILRNQLRGDDIPARYGGEEFVAVLPNTSKEDAVRIAEKVREAIQEHEFPIPAGSVKLTISGGVAAHLTDGRNSNEMLSAADQALYLAKEQGRNRIVVYKSRYLSDDEAETHAVLA